MSAIVNVPPAPFVPAPLPASLRWEELIEGVGRASIALGSLKGGLASMVAPEILLESNQCNEAVMSSRIEGIHTSLESVLRSEAEESQESASSANREVRNYISAMRYAVDQLKQKPMCLNLILEMHRLLMAGTRGSDMAPGRFRTVQNYIARLSARGHEVTYTPPSWKQVLPLMSDLERYYHAPERDRVVQIAMIHAQFEIIHPFLDGNGRVGRMLIPLFLCEHLQMRAPVLNISSILDQKRDEYYTRLAAVTTDGDWTGWVSFFLHCIADQAQADARKAEQVAVLYNELKVRLASTLRSATVPQVLDLIFKHPVFTTPTFIAATGTSTTTASRMLSAMVEAGVIKRIEQGHGRRRSVYELSALLDIVRGPAA